MSSLYFFSYYQHIFHFFRAGQACDNQENEAGLWIQESIIIRIQRSKGIRQWPINCCTSPMMIEKITPSVDHN